MQLYHGDCLELMKNIPDKSVDMVLTDPPYGINYQSQRRKNKDDWKPKIKNDKKPFVEFIPEIRRILKPDGAVAIFTRWDVQQKFIDEMNTAGLRVQNVLIWDKVQHGMGDLKRSFGSRYESIIFHAEPEFRFQGKRPTDILCYNRIAANKMVHPNEKPIQLLEHLLYKCSKNGGVILDMFAGSGSTGVACVNTGRDFIGIELDENYFHIAEKRISDAENQKKLVKSNI